MSDTCAGCGHAKGKHQWILNRIECLPMNESCPCTHYTAPTQTGCVGDSLAASSLAPAWEADNVRRQVLADAEAAWATMRPYQWAHGSYSHKAFVAGYLAARGQTNDPL